MPWTQVYQFNTGSGTGSGAPGPQGPPGQAGASILSFSTQPTPFQGNVGDIAIQANGTVWQKQSGYFGKPPAWFKIANTTGPAGPPGKSIIGPPGPPGPPGPKGNDGTSVSLAIGQPVGGASNQSVLFVDSNGLLAESAAIFSFYHTGSPPDFLTTRNLGVFNTIRVGSSPVFGSVNQILGVDGSGVAMEYKTIASANLSVTVTQGVGTIDLSVSPAIIPVVTNNPPGQKGQDGATWTTGNTIPSRSQGNVGDFYLQANGNVWRKTQPAFGIPPGWVIQSNLTGPPGKQGSQGPPGRAVLSGGGGSNVAFAVQADMESATSTATVVPPAMVQYDVGVAKVLASITWPAGTPTLATAHARNVSSLTDNAAGDVTINFTTSFSSATFGVLAIGEMDGTNTYLFPTVMPAGKAVGSVRMWIYAFNFGSRGDPTSLTVGCFGDQP